MTTQLTIGTDPEMCFEHNGELVKAGDLLRKEAAFGVDGHPWLAELRPKAAVTPREMVQNVRAVLQTGPEILWKYKWAAGPWRGGKPMGGHIHFGVSRTDGMVDNLNNLLAPVLALIEPQDQARTRRTTIFYGNAPYGLLGDIRDKKWGFEWRTPGSFISTPGITLGVMTLGKALIYEEIEGGKFTWRALPPNIRKVLEFTREDFHNCVRPAFLAKIPDLWKVFRKLKYFAKGNEGASLWSSVAYLKSKVIPIEGFDTETDMKIRWGLEKPKASEQPRMSVPAPMPMTPSQVPSQFVQLPWNPNFRWTMFENAVGTASAESVWLTLREVLR